MNMQKLLTWLGSFFSEPNGTGSSARLYMGMIISFTLGAGVSLVWKIHQPVSVADLNSFLGAGAAFIVTAAGPLYLMNKAADVIKSRTGSDGASEKE